MSPSPRVLSLLLCSTMAACGPTIEEEIGETGPDMTFEEFEAATYHEPWEGGVYIVNGDTPIVDIKQLREFYDQLYGTGELIVHQVGGVDAKWSDVQKLNLTYCVSDSFGSLKDDVVAAISAATDGGWETAANVDFIHLAQYDSSCTASNNNVVFDVRPVSGQPYLARAFFPNQSRSSRNVLVDTSAFNTIWPLENILLHELGHALGFRHEHTRPEAGQCFEDNNWRPLTPYDSASTMHYPQCGGSSDDLSMSQLDRQGAAALYGPPGGDPDPDPDPEPDPEGTPRTGSASGTVRRGQAIHYQPLSVLPGTEFEVHMTGSGDPDLYVRFGAPPTLYSFHCRPYLWGAQESCVLTVPSGYSEAYIMVYGYSSGSYTLNASWVEP